MASIDFDDALKGTRVLDLSRLLPGPFCTMLLADMGADIIKVEPPGGGDYARWYPPSLGAHGAFFASLNRNKRSIALDLKKPEGVQALLDMAAGADVLLETFRPGVAARLGVGYEELRARNPAIVCCAITGYGQDGPYAQRAGHDINYLALSGILDLSGMPEQPPAMPGCQIADVGGGAQYAALGICAALLKARATGRGAFIDISMTEGAMSFLLPTFALMAAGEEPKRGRDMLNGGVPCYQLYRCADDRYLAVGALEPKFWARFVQAIERPELLHNGLERGERAREVRDIVAARIGEENAAHWLEIFARVDACVELVQRPSEARAHRQLRERGLFFEIPDGQDEALPQTATPLTTPDRAALSTPPPGLGSDGREILSDFGFDAHRIQHLIERGALVMP